MDRVFGPIVAAENDLFALLRDALMRVAWHAGIAGDVERGMAERSRAFQERGGEIYVGVEDTGSNGTPRKRASAEMTEYRAAQCAAVSVSVSANQPRPRST